ncbi:MAG TPA: hypothetical protein VFU31_07880 [Candidatus Binatia bacterium]|nr:hypothetical protein [Candidatus Binatia bacterium]
MPTVSRQTKIYIIAGIAVIALIWIGIEYYDAVASLLPGVGES